ncbi:hypothetical protein F5887DRAFT_987526 [Amanita rubescens]|nr:hypothetical protein F5887DRAFT_987526 [Amanita rubescens]
MPRVGNQAFVDYLNLHGGNTRINNRYLSTSTCVFAETQYAHRHDLIPVLPGRFLGFHQPNVELHILDDLQWVQCAGEDNTNANCTIGYVANILDGIIDDHSGPYDGILMGC